ncbi:hypothetical protein HAX54_007639, partial [Datura stramonium]|nr:hypothetical protein [Datura stramonium]
GELYCAALHLRVIGQAERNAGQKRVRVEASSPLPNTRISHVFFTDHDHQNTGVVPVVTTLPSCLPKHCGSAAPRKSRRFAIVVGGTAAYERYFTMFSSIHRFLFLP